MALWDWFMGQFNRDNVLQLDIICAELATEVYYKSLAIQACINLIGNTVARSEFLTYENGKEVRRSNYYLFNIEPNLNKSASKFWRDVIHKLVFNNECLVILLDGSLYVADSFDRKKFAFKENIYSNVVIEDFTLNMTFVESDVFYFELHDQKIKNIIDGLYKSYSKLIAASQGYYKKNNARRGTLEIPTTYPQTQEAKEKLEELLNKQIKRFYEAEGGAALPLTNGMKYTEMPSNVGVKGGAEGREIRSFVNDIFDFTAIGFQIPPQLLRGEVADTEKAVDDFLTFCINFLAKILTDEINRKLYRKEAYLNRSYVKLDTTRIRAVNIKDVAGAMDILVRIGAYCVDDCLKLLGMEPLNTDWSRARWMTKNYEQIGKGGEKDGNGKN